MNSDGVAESQVTYYYEGYLQGFDMDGNVKSIKKTTNENTCIHKLRPQ